MTTTQRLTATATDLGYTVETERDQLTARDASGTVRLAATIIDGKFYGGYVVDSLGHVVSCGTVRDMVRFAS